MIPSAEKIVSAYLRSITGERVVSVTPVETLEPWIRVTLLADPSTDGGVADHLIEAMLQVDCFAGESGGQGTVDLLRRTVRESFTTMHTASHTGAVVTGCEVTGTARIPDVAFEPAMERYAMTVTVWMHSV